MNRLFNFKSVHNFRDFGHYETLNGQTVRSGSLFRAAHLNAITPPENSVVEDLDIGLVVDLRYAPERERQPNRLPQKKVPQVFEYPDGLSIEKLGVAPHEMFIQKDLRKPEDARNYMMTSYAARPHDPGFKKIFGDTLRFMAQTGEPILIHCTAGKDRTGTLAAIILASLGVDHDTIMEDYMLTMTAVDVDSFLEPAAKMMGARFEREYDPEALRPMFGVEEDYLLAALETIGDMETYVSDTLGLSQADKKMLRDKYLAAPSS